MPVQFYEDENTFSCTLTLDEQDWVNHFNCFSDTVLSARDHSASYNVTIFHLGDEEESFVLDADSLDNTETCIKEIFQFENDRSNVSVKLVATKQNPDRVLQIYSSEHFVAYLESKKMTLQFKFILATLKNKYDCIRHVNFDARISDVSLAYGDSHILSNKTRALHDVIDIESCYVEYLNDLNKKFFSDTLLFDYILKLRTLASLAVLCRKCALDRLNFVFDGDKTLDLMNEEIEFYHSYGQVIYDMYLWGYCDERHPTRVSIINHVIAQHQHVRDSFKRYVFDILESNYKVYITDNFEQYVEVTSKLSDFLYETTTKISDKISDSISSARNVLILTLSYFFTIIVFTGIDKGKVENVFNFDIAALSTIFIVGGLLNLYWIRKEIVSNAELARTQLNEMVDRYTYYIGDGELDGIRQCKSLSEVETKAKERRVYVSTSVVLLVLLFFVWGMYSLKSPLPFWDSIVADTQKTTAVLTKTENKQKTDKLKDAIATTIEPLDKNTGDVKPENEKQPAELLKQHE
ncbi:hypothetical protein ACXZ7L_22405 [Vibrio campbellii]|uniref:hypothetical protein n=1 Tax=Vibrio harveyi group TaxID=717610 RepID=UPI00168D2ED7|nr:hypothetical protein [Vibrio campbellii]HDM8238601.1 hypothetical protein [Vibrio campbellii]